MSNKIKTDPSYTNIFKNIDKTEEEYIIQNIYSLKTALNEYINEYEIAKQNVGFILREANKEKKLWNDTINTFNERFNMPFTLSIKNIKNAVLELNGMEVEFLINDKKCNKEKVVENVLSNGEKKALYLLEMIFIVEKMKKENKFPVLIFDDIADSFDYTNKHAIIEYLYDISKDYKFIVLTHNFDFYRHFGLKVSTQGNCYFANKEYSNSKITLQNGGYFSNVFEQLYKNKIGKNKFKFDIAAIPFSRGVIELTKGESNTNADYMFFTNLLHYKPGKGSSCKMKKLYELYKKIYPTEKIDQVIISKNDYVYKIIIEQASEISKEKNIAQNLEEKIILAIALRLCCEKYMYKRLKRKKKITNDEMDRMMIGELYHKKYKNVFPKDLFNNAIEKVCILVPQIIHFNGFMYEPLIDFSIDRLRSLFKAVYQKTNHLFNINSNVKVVN